MATTRKLGLARSMAYRYAARYLEEAFDLEPTDENIKYVLDNRTSFLNPSPSWLPQIREAILDMQNPPLKR